MNEEQFAVCVAINNNRSAWYEMLVPFILSLRQTNFAGHLVVIGYGLSERKIEILRQQGVNVFVGTRGPLAVGRFIEVAEICKANPHLTKIALYDADIWFPHRTFDLFDAVEGDEIHAGADVMFCNFIAAPLIGPRKEENLRLVFDEITRRFGTALQAGLLAGTAKAWRDFADHIQDGLARIGDDFAAVFGLDTTLLHLWGAKGGVTLLPRTQNFIFKFGLIETFHYETQTLSFLSAEGPVRGLHMSGDIRFLDRWRYLIHHADHALTAGQVFALSPPDLAPAVPLPADAVRILREFGLEVATLLLEAKGAVHAFEQDGNVFLHGAGNHVLTLTAVEAFPTIQLYMTHLSGFPSPIKMAVEVNGSASPSAPALQTNYGFNLAAGQDMTLRATSLPGQMCGATWILSRQPFISQ